MLPHDRSTRVAIVDDHPLVRRGMQRLLAQQDDWKVVFSGDTLEPLRSGEISCEICLLDINLHGNLVDRQQVEALVARNIRILVVTALDSPNRVRELALAGVSGVLAKSEPDETVLRALQAVRAGDVPLDNVLSAIADSADVPSLTHRESEVLELYTAGLTIHSVARKLEISEHTVKYYLREIRRKFTSMGYPATTQLDLAKSAGRAGLVDW